MACKRSSVQVRYPPFGVCPRNIDFYATQSTFANRSFSILRNSARDAAPSFLGFELAKFAGHDRIVDFTSAHRAVLSKDIKK